MRLLVFAQEKLNNNWFSKIYAYYVVKNHCATDTSALYKSQVAIANQQMVLDVKVVKFERALEYLKSALEN